MKGFPKKFGVAGMLLLLFPQGSVADTRLWAYACTADGVPVRMRLVAPLRDIKSIELSFRNIAKRHSSEWFVSNQRAPDDEWQAEFSDLQRSAGPKLPRQQARAVARSIDIGTLPATKRVYCGNSAGN